VTSAPKEWANVRTLPPPGIDSAIAIRSSASRSML
jgi:hypothetical protein